MSDKWEEYVKDPRSVCKYSSKCYQKNPEHHAKFKHPPPKNSNKTHENRNIRKFEPYSKKTPKAVAIQSDTNEETNKSDDLPNSESNEVSISTTLPKNISFYDKNTAHNMFEELFKVKMPEDFFKFYECITDHDLTMEKMLGSVNLELIGPFDLLLGKLPVLEDKELYLIHWRFFFDPPEFQTLLKKKNSEYHIGYFRDDPKENPVFVASNDSAKDCHITPMGYNIFGAVYLYLQNEKKHSPFTAVSCQKLMNKIKTYSEEHNISLEEYTMKKRSSSIVTKSFHGAGIVVPYEKKTQLGYRRLVETDTNLKKLFTDLKNATCQSEKDKVLSDIQPVITYASIAVDECDFGTGLEVGIDLFCSGLKELEPSALSSLTSTYILLGRTAFSDIIQAHIKHRRRGSNMSVLSLND